MQKTKSSTMIRIPCLLKTKSDMKKMILKSVTQEARREKSKYSQ